MIDCLIHAQILQVQRLVCDDHVHVVRTAQAVVCHAKQAVRIGRQIDARHLRALIRDDIQKARILVGEAIVILTPDERRNQEIDRRDRGSPAQLQPLGVLVEHRVNDMHKGFIG